ncbi:DUF3796 domain-containing protein [Candidatus Bathyarchaeota archaeon]|nr:DUF3796 domain-containing protein [Candidatus Bathyarchaeota archaeon]MBS7631547.1 DUF3796 domain-containing protein [Candidatus Bathyarchaeota archaeon]
MRKNKVGYLGLLGFLGLLGLFSGNSGFYGFFGFFGFFSALWGRGSDERIDRNVERSCRNAFVFTMTASALFIAFIAALRALDVFQIAFSALFAGNVILFVGSFIYYNTRGE